MFKKFKLEIYRFFNCEKGAITIIVTLLLVPAILITGTGVEIARIFANRTMTQNAGELSANAALSQYDAILKDMYGLYAIALNDENLAILLNKYAQMAFDEGESTLFLSSGEVTGNLNTSESNYYLSNREILARQIQEYCKLRGIGALANDFIDKFNIFDFSKLKIDLDIFDKKLEVDDQFKALIEQYADFYYRMRYNDYFIEDGTVGIVGELNEKKVNAEALVGRINTIVGQLQTYKNNYDTAKANRDTAQTNRNTSVTNYNNAVTNRDDAQTNYDSVEENYNSENEPIKKAEFLETMEQYKEDIENYDEDIDDYEAAMTTYNNQVNNYNNAMETHLNNFNNTRDSLVSEIETFEHNFPDLNSHEHKLGDSNNDPWYIEVLKDITGGRIYEELMRLLAGNGADIKYYKKEYQNPDCLDSYSYNLEQIIGSAQEINKQIDEFKRKRDALEIIIPTGSDMTKETMTDQSKMYDSYMNKIEVGIVQNIANSNKNYIIDYYNYFTEELFTFGGGALGYDQVSDIISDLTIESSSSTLTNAQNITFARYTKEWRTFCELLTSGIAGNPFSPDDAPDGLQGLYWILALQYANEDEEAENKFKKVLNDIGKSISGLTDELLSGLQPYPLGHDYIPTGIVLPSQGIGATNASESFTKLELDNIGESNKQTRGFLKKLKNLLESFSALADSALDKTLLTVYSSHMFSNYATAKKESMAGYKFNAQLNYMQGAEQEYLIFGNRDGFTNLAAFGGVIIAIRTVFNFISTFIIQEVNGLVNSVAAAAAAVPIIGPALWLLVQGGMRIAIAAGESVIDLYLLRKGKSVPIIKFNSTDFVVGCPTGFAKFLESLAKDAQKKVDKAEVSLVKDLVKTGLSTSTEKLNFKSQTTPDFTSAKKLDLEAKAKHSTNPGVVAETLVDGLLLSVHVDYHNSLNSFVEDKVNLQNALYVQEVASDLNLPDTDRDAYIAGYYNYISTEHEEWQKVTEYEEIKNYLDRDATIMRNDIEWARTHPEYKNDYFDEFKNSNGVIINHMNDLTERILKEKFEQFTPSKIKETFTKKFSLNNLIAVDYSFYTGIWMLLIVKRDDLLSRMADLISLNVANKSSNLTPQVDNYKIQYAASYKDSDTAEANFPPMTKAIFDKYTLDKRRTFIQVDIDYNMRWAFFSLPLFRNDSMNTGVVFAPVFSIRERVYRGY